MSHVELLANQHPQVLLSRPALNPFNPEPVLAPGVVLTQVQDLTLGLSLLKIYIKTRGIELILERSIYL